MHNSNGIMEPKYEYWKDENGRWHFHLRGRNGIVQIASGSYCNKQGVQKGIEDLRKNSASGRVECLTPPIVRPPPAPKTPLAPKTRARKEGGDPFKRAPRTEPESWLSL